jgi:hypothetical protein
MRFTHNGWAQDWARAKPVQMDITDANQNTELFQRNGQPEEDMGPPPFHAADF